MRKTLQIGSVTLPNNLILAPMAGVSDLSFRLLCKEQGAGLVCMEMISAKAIYYGNRHTDELMATTEAERPVSLQLFGNDPEIMASMADESRTGHLTSSISTWAVRSRRWLRTVRAVPS